MAVRSPRLPRRFRSALRFAVVWRKPNDPAVRRGEIRDSEFQTANRGVDERTYILRARMGAENEVREETPPR